MKNYFLKSLQAIAIAALSLFMQSAKAQVTKDTVKPGRTNDSMAIDQSRMNPVIPAEGMAVLTDTGFISKNIADNRTEIEMARVALKKGTGAQVKKVAQQLVTDHTAMLKALQTLAATRAISAQKEPNTDKMPTEISLLPGKDFNASWASAMLTMHEAKITELEAFLPVTQNAELKALIGVALPKLREHRAMLLKIPGAQAVNKQSRIA